MAVTDNSPNKGRWAEDQYDRLPALAAELVSRQVAVSEAIGRELVVACRYPPTLRSIMTTPAMLSCSSPAGGDMPRRAMSARAAAAFRVQANEGSTDDHGQPQCDRKQA
jgi:hypothetical protein